MNDYSLMATDDMMTEGIRDRIIEGFLGRFVDIAGIKRGDPKAIRDAAKMIAGFMNFKEEAEEVDEIIAEILTKDFYGAAYQLGDALMKFAGPKASPPYPAPSPVITTMARKNIKDMTAADCETWLADNKANVRNGADTWFCRRVLRKLPEVQSALEGKMTTAQLETMALDPDQVVKWLNRAIMLLTLVSIAYPPLGAVVVVLKLILARFESNNPDVGLPLTALAA